ncbi:MAG: C69 family dipeptidase [Acidimicrobiia bacterium]|nr:C69 family dipeptidase [Acidimicrobiia bacterium]
MCDTMVVVRPQGLLFAKNSGRDPNEAQFLCWQPRAVHEPGSRLRCTWMEIDQAAQTHAVLLSRPFWMWGAEMGANEHGVTIGNEAVFTKEAYAKVGLTGMDLLRLALERAATAEQGVATIVELLERYGQGGGCGHERRGASYHNSFIVADRGEAYVLETAGAKWAVEQVTEGARSISNGLTIPGFADRYAEPIHTHFSRCRTRRAITESGAGRATGPGDLMAVLRDHGTGGLAPHYDVTTGALGPCMHAGGTIAASQTAASWVADLGSDGDRHWATATAAPCTGIFKPVRVTEPLDLGPTPADTFDPECLWWRHELLHRRALTDPERLTAAFAPERDDLEAKWLVDPPEPAAAFAEADRLVAAWTETVARELGRDRRPFWARRYWQVRNRRAGVPVAAHRDSQARAS